MKDRNDIGPEVIAEYPVSTNRKKLWVCELDLLAQLDQLCEKLGIQYFVLWGSAIGALRHKGFIPWDDDIDIGMIREDFEILRQNCHGAFPGYVDIQYGISDHGVDNLLRIRDGRTTGIINHEMNMPGNKGAFIEIYPFDHFSSVTLGKIQTRINLVIYRCMYTKLNHIDRKGIVGCFYRTINRLFTLDTLWKTYEKVGKLQNKRKGKYIDTPTIPSIYTLRGEHLFYVEDCSETLTVPYEYTTIRIPKGYDRVLKQQYPTYMELPPVEKRGVHHSNKVFYDPNKPYTEYIGNRDIEAYFAGDNSYELL